MTDLSDAELDALEAEHVERWHHMFLQTRDKCAWCSLIAEVRRRRAAALTRGDCGVHDCPYREPSVRPPDGADGPKQGGDESHYVS